MSRALATYRGARRNAYRLAHRIREWSKNKLYIIVHRVQRWIDAPDPQSKTQPPALSRQYLPVRREQYIHESLRIAASPA